MEKNLSRQENEYNRLIKILDFRLPHIFKKIGLIGAILLLFVLFGSKFLGIEGIIAKDVLRTTMLLFMLMASLSKDAFEDEYSKHVRFQSYVLAFVALWLIPF